MNSRLLELSQDSWDNESGREVRQHLDPGLTPNREGLGMEPTPKLCTMDDCARPFYARGWCNTHYERWRRTGTPLVAVVTPEQRFWSKVDAGDCWEWTGYRYPNGYGNAWAGKARLAHRLAYEYLVGPIPSGMVIDHLCRNRSCVNPDHLRVVTGAVNTLAGYNPMALNARLVQCQRGHEFTIKGTRRECDECRADSQRRRRAAKRAAAAA